MADETIAAALTPEEWARYQSYGDLTLPLNTAIGCLKGGELTRHGLAAVCLHEQPFGFTQDDVDTLERLSWEMARGDGNALASISERIAALLPPEQP